MCRQFKGSKFTINLILGVVVRAEEVGIVIVVLLLWVAAIALFINRYVDP